LTSSKNKIHLQAVKILEEAEITARVEEKKSIAASGFREKQKNIVRTQTIYG
jgi:hypothetical protein